MSTGPFPDPDDAGDEAALVRAAQAGDQQAFKALWKASERQAHALCLRLTGNRTDAADALQECQIAVWRNLHRFEHRCPFGAWVFTIARNAALSVIRSRGRRPETTLDDFEDRPRDSQAAPFADVLVETMAVQDALETLPEKHREALLLWVGGLSYAQVAELMGAPLNSVKVWIYRARTALREQLGR
ncbi:RNA polymerase sigma factor [Pseudonocardia broussonetiae]|uniref:RNA polymerase sigma factor n=1 Tax=Pseudonocardia broussonetiae TaxID=2736640 RepID=A0A6M6JNU7_9PSEU|nr:RNA polymerase sigma factor [Pseudonocardia broussonetiae]QJY48647.1 RNA polymerase sigma factor [Pseudonocardia broussonetiae]